jgi:hypothetical protein
MLDKTPSVSVFTPPSLKAFQAIEVNIFRDFLHNTYDELLSLSNTVKLWDCIPKYSLSQVEQNRMRSKDGQLPVYRKEFRFMDCDYCILITPAFLSIEDGRAYFPSANEELVEDALRKMATLQNQCFFDKEKASCGITFTLHQLRTELKKQGHSRSYQEVVKSLLILARSDIEIYAKNSGGQGFSIEKFIRISSFSSNTELDNSESRWVAFFHPLVYKAMNDIEYRQFNYRQMMQLKTHLARWLYKRLAYYYTNAAHTVPIKLSLAHIREESGMLERSRSNDAIKELEAVFEVFMTIKVFNSFKRIKDIRGERNKVIDIIYEAHPHSDFIKSVKAANKRQSDGREKRQQKTVGLTRQLR